MTEPYTPTTDAIRFAVSIGMWDHRAHIIQPDDKGGAAFDAWLAARDAQVLRDAAAAMRRHKDPGHWNLRDEEFPADMAQPPDRWLERRADRIAEQAGDGR